MAQLQVKTISKGFVQPLFTGVNLQARGTMKIGLIGDNGSGKSTLLKILSGGETADSGEILWSQDTKIGYLEQEIVSDSFDVSGGEKKILKITELFYSDLNVLLLDEPDNHLDLDHKQWFMELVKEFSGIVIVISHDRTFLEEAVDNIWHLEEAIVTAYSFGYKRFRDIYEDTMASRQHLWEVQEKERLRLLDLVKRLRVQAAANDAFVGRYHSAEKRYDRWVRDMVEKPPEQKTVHMQTQIQDQHAKKTAVYIDKLEKSYSKNHVLHGTHLHAFCGEKIAISAPNGSGKSTLLNIIVGKTSADSGTVQIGSGLRIGYYAQDHLAALDEQLSPLEELQKSKGIYHYDGIAYLKKFLFSAAQIGQPIKLLSGGQKSRLQLAKFLATNPDILVLDEPTNHLDLRTVLALERFLQTYEGTLLLVSHDQHLVRACVQRQMRLNNGLLHEVTT